MEKLSIETSQAPKPIGPYSQAIQVGPWIILSGQIPLKPDGSVLNEAPIIQQAEQVFENIRHVLEAAGCGFEHVVKSTLYLTSMADFPVVNEIYARYFKPPYPARTTVAVKELPKQVAIEVEVWAYRP